MNAPVEQEEDISCGQIVNLDKSHWINQQLESNKALAISEAESFATIQNRKRVKLDIQASSDTTKLLSSSNAVKEALRDIAAVKRGAKPEDYKGFEFKEYFELLHSS